ncbi:MAG: glutathione S-transferase family protein [Pseudomonadota bacterium]
MPPTLHYHPLSSYCHKVLIALYELDIPFERHLLNLGDPAERDAFLALWPTGKMPLLVHDGAVVAETSVIIEHLGLRCGRGSLLPADAAAALDVRLWDRLFDLYVMTPMQAIVADRLRDEKERDPLAVGNATRTLSMAYEPIEQRLEGRTWACGDAFTMADCAAAPALFYASTLVPFPAANTRLAAYFERLVQRPSVARTLEEAKPFFQYYPFREALPARFLS